MSHIAVVEDGSRHEYEADQGNFGGVIRPSKTLEGGFTLTVTR